MSAWLTHLAKFRADNPHYKGNIMVAARATYNQVPVYPRSLTDFLEHDILGNVVEKYCAVGKIKEQAKQLKNAIDSVKTEDLDSIQNILCEYMDLGVFASQKGDRFLLKIVGDDDYALIKKLIVAYHADGGSRYMTPLKFDTDI